MPTYEYLCKTCGHGFETVQSFKDDSFTVCDQAPITCPRSGGGELRKVFGNVGITFKGDGFYKNDSRGSSSSPAKEGAASSSSESSSSTSTESSAGTTTTTSTTDSGHSHSHAHGPHTHTH